MRIGLYTLTSLLHNEEAVNAASAVFVSAIEAEAGFTFDFKGADFKDYGSHDLELIYVRTGGTEGLFKEVYGKLDGKIHILTSGKSNSLAASMEILSFLNQQGRSGEIIHGSIGYIAERIGILARVEAARKHLSGTRLGIIGEPSDWLISSMPDRQAAEEKLGINLVDISISEFMDEYDRIPVDYNLAGPVRNEFNANAHQSLHKYADGAFRIYAALKGLVARHNLSGLTLRCFDLLEPLGNTGCLALALLNAEGIPAGCEGDMPALLTMSIGKAVTGQCGFQANPSHIDPETGEMLLAHCTVPFDMIRKYSFNTHYESGIGIALHGELPEGKATIFKVSGDLSRAFCNKAELVRNQYETNLCRTQVILKPENHDDCARYFLNDPIGNHHIIFTGDHTTSLTAFFNSITQV